MKYRGVFCTIIVFFCLRFTVYGLQMITLQAIPPIEVINCKPSTVNCKPSTVNSKLQSLHFVLELFAVAEGTVFDAGTIVVDGIHGIV